MHFSQAPFQQGLLLSYMITTCPLGYFYGQTEDTEGTKLPLLLRNGALAMSEDKLKTNKRKRGRKNLINRESPTRHQRHAVNDQLPSALQGVSHSKDSPGLQESCVRQQADEKRSALSAPHGCFNTYTQRESNEWRIYLTSLTGQWIYM